MTPHPAWFSLSPHAGYFFNPMPKQKELKPKQRKFVAEYLKDQNGTQAAIRAGYAKNSAQQQASDLLLNPLIRQAIDKHLEKVTDEALVTVEYVIQGFRDVFERCMVRHPVMEFDYVNKEMTQKKKPDPETGEMVGVWEFDSAGANRALRSLGDYLKLFVDRREYTGKDGAPLIPPTAVPTGNVDTSDQAAKRMEELMTLSEQILKKAVSKYKPDDDKPRPST